MIKQKESQPTKVEKIGDNEFAVHHDDGSRFEGTGDTKVIDRMVYNNKKVSQRLFHGVDFDKDGKVI